MNPNVTPETVPFRLMRSTLKMLQALTLISVTATNLHKTHPLIAAKVFALRDKTSALKNPLHQTMLVHCVAWYMVDQEIAEAVKETHPDLAHSINAALLKSGWLSKIVNEYKKVEA